MLINPFGPNKALNAAAVTTVGSINGIVNNALNIFFPGKLNREKIHAVGNPAISVNIVEMIACQNVNQNTCPILDQLIVISSAKYLNALRKIENNGKK